MSTREAQIREEVEREGMLLGGFVERSRELDKKRVGPAKLRRPKGQRKKVEEQLRLAGKARGNITSLTKCLRDEGFSVLPPCGQAEILPRTFHSLCPASRELVEENLLLGWEETAEQGDVQIESTVEQLWASFEEVETCRLSRMGEEGFPRVG